MSPELIDALSSMGLLGGSILAVWGFATGRVVTDKALAKCDESWQKRQDEATRACTERIAKLEGKLDEATALILRQTEAQQLQIAAQQQMIGALQAAQKGIVP